MPATVANPPRISCASFPDFPRFPRSTSPAGRHGAAPLARRAARRTIGSYIEVRGSSALLENGSTSVTLQVEGDTSHGVGTLTAADGATHAGPITRQSNRTAHPPPAPPRTL